VFVDEVDGVEWIEGGTSPEAEQAEARDGEE